MSISEILRMASLRCGSNTLQQVTGLFWSRGSRDGSDYGAFNTIRSDVLY
jgi:hypothetical protein